METSTSSAVQEQGELKKCVNGTTDRKGRRPSMQGMRRSCDRCGRNKKRCDGEWPCRRCLGSGNECTYSKRRSPHPQQQQQRQQQQQQQQQQQTRPAGVHPTKVLLHSTSGAVLAYGMVSFKRCRLSASPATGLVGMKENSFLSDFFSCVGFLPLTTQSHIRESMVKVMARPAVRQPSGSLHGSLDRGRFDAATSGDRAMEGSQFPMDPSICTFWCAVALGALVKGGPIESVVHYSQLAGGALESYSGPVTADLAKASTILAYLYGFMGYKAKFEEQLEFSNSILAAFVKQGSTDDALPVGVAEIIHHSETTKWCNVDPGEIESLCAPHGLPQIIGAADERDLYTSAAQSFRMFEENVYAKAVRMSDRARSRGDEPCKEGASRPGSLYHPQMRLPAETVSSAMVKEMQGDNLIEFERLEAAVDRPTIRKGIGSLIISGTLVFNKAANGDAYGTLERISRCVEVYERYPGLCRCMMRWSHIAHVLLGALAALDGPRAAELYDRLGTTYNQNRPLGSVPVPPLEEWRGISSFCQEFHCRTLECFIMREGLSVFSAPSEQARDSCPGNKPIDFDGQQQRSARLIPEEGMAGPPIPVAACNGRTDVETPADACSTSPQPAQVDWPARPSAPPASHPHGELETIPDTDVVPDTSSKGVMHGKGGLDGLGDPPDMAMVSRGLSEVDGLQYATGGDGIAAADWLDVTHAMLSAIDDPDPVSV